MIRFVKSGDGSLCLRASVVAGRYHIETSPVFCELQAFSLNTLSACMIRGGKSRTEPCHVGTVGSVGFRSVSVIRRNRRNRHTRHGNTGPCVLLVGAGVLDGPKAVITKTMVRAVEDASPYTGTPSAYTNCCLNIRTEPCHVGTVGTVGSDTPFTIRRNRHTRNRGTVLCVYAPPWSQNVITQNRPLCSYITTE